MQSSRYMVLKNHYFVVFCHAALLFPTGLLHRLCLCWVLQQCKHANKKELIRERSSFCGFKMNSQRPMWYYNSFPSRESFWVSFGHVYFSYIVGFSFLWLEPTTLRRIRGSHFTDSIENSLIKMKWVKQTQYWKFCVVGRIGGMVARASPSLCYTRGMFMSIVYTQLNQHNVY